MRVVMVVPSFPKLSETFIVSKFLGLLERGWDVQVVCRESLPEQWGHFAGLEKSPEVRKRVHVCWPVRPPWRAALLWPLMFARCFSRNPKGTWRYLREGINEFGAAVLRQLYLDAELVSLGADLVHFEFGSLAVERMYLKELLGCKIVVSFRGYDLNLVGLDQPGFYESVWKHADSLHLLGNDLWSRAQRRGCPANKPHVLIAPALDISRFNPGPGNGGGERPVRILSVGRLEWKKGYEYAMQAMHILKGWGIAFEYRIVGGGKQLEAVAFARHQLGVSEEVQLLGPISPADVHKQLEQAAIFLHSAVSEGFCNAVLEAQAMGLPVVTSDADGLSENVVDGETGFVVPRRSPQPMAEGLAVLARDPDLRKRMGEAGRKRVATHFRIEEQIAAFEKLYRDVIR